MFSILTAFPNNSHGMDQAFKGHCEKERNTYSKQSREKIKQAARKLSRGNVQAKKERPAHEVASIVKSHLKDDQGGMLFKNLDPYQHGHITEDDFMHILSTKNTGLSRSEMKEVAHQLDCDRSGLLNYSNIHSSLQNLSETKVESETNSYSKAYEESKRIDVPTGDASSNGSYSKNFEESKLQKSHKTAPADSLKEPSTQQLGYDGLQQYLDFQSKVNSEAEIIAQKKSANESRYGDAFDRVTLMEKPSNNFAPKVSVKVHDNVTRYSKGSGNIPQYTAAANINDVVFNHFVAGRTGKRDEAVFGEDEVIGTLDYEKVGGLLGDENKEESYNEPSYTKTFESLKSAISDKPSGAKAHHQTSHHKSFVPLPTTKVTGGVDPDERMYLGNPNSARNRNSRAFHNSFIFDHRVPARLRRNEKRSHSAPPGRRHFNHIDNKKSSDSEFNDPRVESVGSLFNFLSTASDTHSVVPSPVRVHSRRNVQRDDPERKKLAEFACAPGSPPKKKDRPDANSIKRSMNTLITQCNNHSKLKILNHKLKRIDVSNSGYVNKSEFASALREMGVKISPSQVTTLYEANAKDNVGLGIDQCSSLKLCSHQRGINVQDFIQKMRTRASSNMMSARDGAECHSTFHEKTPLEREDDRVWKKLVETLSEENITGKRIIANFFREAQVNHDNEVSADKLYNELNYVGAKLDDVEYRNMLSNIKRKPNGTVDVDDFAREYHKRSMESRDSDKWMTLMPSLAHKENPNVEAKGEQFKRVLKTQKKHFVKKIGAESANDPLRRTADFTQRLNNPVVAATNSLEKSHVPSCLTMSDAKEFREERLKWSKLSNTFLQHKNTLLSAFGGAEGVHKPLSDKSMKDKLYEAGVLLGNDDLKILQSYTKTSTSHEKEKELTFGKMCSAMGLNLDRDNRQRMTLTSSSDFQRDCGIFGSSSSSILSSPNYQSSMLTASTLDDKFVKGNRKKRVDDETGLPMKGAPQPLNAASEFWKMKHVPEIKMMPAKQLSYHQRLGLPESSFNTTSVNGSSGRGFTSLRQLKEERKRSSSAPPRYSTISRNSEEQFLARSHMWQRESRVEGRNLTKNPVSSTAGPSRFAAAPLAEYISMKQQQKLQGSVGNADNSAPMTTQDLQVSYSSTSEVDTQK